MFVTKCWSNHWSLYIQISIFTFLQKEDTSLQVLGCRACLGPLTGPEQWKMVFQYAGDVHLLRTWAAEWGSCELQSQKCTASEMMRKRLTGLSLRLYRFQSPTPPPHWRRGRQGFRLSGLEVEIPRVAKAGRLRLLASEERLLHHPRVYNYGIDSEPW